MPRMARKPRKPAEYKHPRVVFHVPQDLLDVIDKRAEDNGRTRTSELVMVLREAYQRLGLYQPKAEQAEGEDKEGDE